MQLTVASVVVVLVVPVCALTSSGPIRNTKTGQVKGITTTEGQSYLGIPYGKAQRFSHSVPPDSWEGTRSAEQYGAQCTQPPSFCSTAPRSCNNKMSEDCLTLNVYTPHGAGSNSHRRITPRNYAVLVWIHGGYYQAYTAGSPYYNGLVLASAARIIIVTLNYRLGPLGFLKIPGVNRSGNYGFYDQRLALEWVRDNIGYFGGDPERVTLAGESAGAHAALYHMMTPGSKPLFHRAIMMSLPAIEVPTSAVADKTAQALLKNLNCDTSIDTLQCLRDNTAENIAMQSLLLSNPDNFLHRSLRFGVYIDNLEITEGFYDNVDKENKFGDKPAIIGSSAYDALRSVYTSLPRPVPSSFFPLVFGQWRPDIVQKTFERYVSSQSDPSDIRPEISEALTDAIYACPARFFADHMVQNNQVWMYVFSQPNLESYTTPVSCEDRACHVDDIPYLFRHPDDVEGVEDVNFDRMSNLMLKYFGNFVKTANPYSRGTSPRWSMYADKRDNSKPSERPVLELRYPEPRIVKDFRKERCDYWDSIGYKKEILVG